MDSLRDWKFVVGASIIGYLVLSQWYPFNSIVSNTAQQGGNYTQILQGRGPDQFIRMG